MTVALSRNFVKRRYVRKLIFGARSITRQDLIRISGLSGRTVDKYTGELKAQRLIQFSSGPPEGRQGRPGVVYMSNSENIYFAGISLIEWKLCFAVIDINSYLIYSRVVEMPDDPDGKELIRLGFTELEQIRRTFPEKAMSSLCFSLNTYCQPAKRAAVFYDFFREARKRYGLQMEFHESSAILLHRLYAALACSGSLAYFIPGDEIRLHVVTDGEIREDLAGYVRKFRHSVLDKNSKFVCPHNRRSCVEALLTYRAVLLRYYDLIESGFSRNVRNSLLEENRFNVLNFLKKNGKNYARANTLSDLIILAETGDPMAAKILEENGKYIALAATQLKRELHLDRIVLSLQGSFLTNSFLKHYTGLNGETASIFNYNGWSVSDAIFAAPEMMRRRLLDLHLVT